MYQWHCILLCHKVLFFHCLSIVYIGQSTKQTHKVHVRHTTANTLQGADQTLQAELTEHPLQYWQEEIITLRANMQRATERLERDGYTANDKAWDEEYGYSTRASNLVSPMQAVSVARGVADSNYIVECKKRLTAICQHVALEEGVRMSCHAGATLLTLQNTRFTQIQANLTEVHHPPVQRTCGTFLISHTTHTHIYIPSNLAS